MERQDWDGETPPEQVLPTPQGSIDLYPYGECTWWIADQWKKTFAGTPYENAAYYDRGTSNIQRHAKVHPELARKAGLRVDGTPRTRAYVVFKSDAVILRDGKETRPFLDFGHVAWVEKVEGSRIFVSQYNYPSYHAHSEQWFNVATVDVFISPPVDGTPNAKPADVSTGHTELSAYLASKGSPYAHVDITAHCDSAGITREQCRLLVAICGKESKHGTAYKNSKGRDASEGHDFHNCGGVKRGSWNREYPYDPSTGWWLVKFPDWDTYWREYPKGMKKGWFDKHADTANDLCWKYVGSPNVCEVSWVDGVNFFLSEIPQIT